MAQFYLLLKTIHLTLVLTSGAFFLVRGLAVLSGAGWPLTRLVRRLSQSLDTLLLLSALLLLHTLQLNPFTTPWLRLKLGLLVAYIVLGFVALHRARNRTVRVVSFVLALCCFGMIYRVARGH